MARPDMMLWLDSARGVYIPQNFVESFKDFDKAVANVAAEDKAAILAGPDSEGYWEAWDSLCEDAVVTDDSGNKYRVYQDGDCWLIPIGMEYSEETDTFVWPEDRPQENPE